MKNDHKKINKYSVFIMKRRLNNGNNEIALVIEKEEHDTSTLFNYLKTKVPNYMMPTQTYFLDQLPHNINGKLDRKELRNWIKNTMT